MRLRVLATVAVAVVLFGYQNGQPAVAAPATTAPATDSPYTFGFQPLWPFPDRAEADAWLREWKLAGESGWHADPASTASKFTREFLGFAELDRITAAKVEAREAWIGVGQADPLGRPITVATVHLVRFGPDADAPWEVVGTEDTDLTLDVPAYGSPLSRSVIDAGGLISGVDESLQLKALQPGVELGDYCCVPAGGERSPWNAQIRIVGDPRPGAVTIVVWTGGHYALIERFAVTGVLGG